MYIYGYMGIRSACKDLPQAEVLAMIRQETRLSELEGKEDKLSREEEKFLGRLWRPLHRSISGYARFLDYVREQGMDGHDRQGLQQQLTGLEAISRVSVSQDGVYYVATTCGSRLPTSSVAQSWMEG